MFPSSEITEIKLVNVDDPAKPMELHYRLRAPLYAQATGKRLLFEASPFRRAIASPFTASQRRYPISFPYGWKEVDHIFIQLPTGWKLDNADNPGNLDFGKPGSYTLTIGVTPSSELELQRTMVFGNEGMVFYSAQSYQALKAAFDQIQLHDRHSLSLKEGN
jgi:hypothetical protein